MRREVGNIMTVGITVFVVDGVGLPEAVTLDPIIMLKDELEVSVVCGCGVGVGVPTGVEGNWTGCAVSVEAGCMGGACVVFWHSKTNRFS